MPTLSFGIDFDKSWGVGKAAVELVADGYVRMRAKSNLVGSGYGFGYGIDVGAVLIAQAVVPDAFGWQPATKRLAPLERNIIPGTGVDEFECLTGGGSKRSISSGPDGTINVRSVDSNRTASRLSKRLVPYGPIIRLPKSEQLCLNKGGTPESSECSDIFGTDDLYEQPTEEERVLRKRSDTDSLDARHDVQNQELRWLDARASRTKRSLSVCIDDAKMETGDSRPYDDATVIYDNAD